MDSLLIMRVESVLLAHLEVRTPQMNDAFLRVDTSADMGSVLEITTS